jgi:hypothetical protein
MRDKIKGRRLNWAEVGATRFPDFCGVAIVKSGWVSSTFLIRDPYLARSL